MDTTRRCITTPIAFPSHLDRRMGGGGGYHAGVYLFLGNLLQGGGRVDTHSMDRGCTLATIPPDTSITES